MCGLNFFLISLSSIEVIFLIIGCTALGSEQNRHTVSIKRKSAERGEKSRYPLAKLSDLASYPGLALQQSSQLAYHKRIHAFHF